MDLPCTDTAVAQDRRRRIRRPPKLLGCGRAGIQRGQDVAQPETLHSWDTARPGIRQGQNMAQTGYGTVRMQRGLGYGTAGIRHRRDTAQTGCGKARTWHGRDVAQQGCGTARQERGLTQCDREPSQHPSLHEFPPAGFPLLTHLPLASPKAPGTISPQNVGCGLGFAPAWLSPGAGSSPVWAGTVSLSMTLQRNQLGLEPG